MSLNRVVLVGRLVRDPDLKYTGTNGTAVANFTIAVNRPFKSKDGEQDADFINCVVWRKPAENLANYMKKGNQIGVDGRLQSRTYDDKDGKKVFVTEVVADSVQFLEPKNSQDNTGNEQQSTSNSQKGTQNQSNSTPNQNDPFKNDGTPIDIEDDDLPF